MKSLFIVLFLTFSTLLMGQDIEVSFAYDAPQEDTSQIERFEPIQQTRLCIPIVEKTDSSTILNCEGIRIEIQDTHFYGYISYVVIPNTTEVRVKTMYYLPMPPEEDYIKK